MSTTLTNGLKLPDKGSVDWYADMQNNYAILDGAVGTVAEHTTALAGKAPAVHTHTKADITDFPSYGTTAGTICEGNDSRLSDARTPVAHTHTKSDVTDLLNSNFIPSANNSYDLGSSSYQWNNLYAKNYYYNGTAWGLDKANTWSADNIYTYAITLKQTNLEEGVLPASTQTKRFRITDKNNANLGWLQHRINTSGDSYLEFYVVNKFSNGQLSAQGSEISNVLNLGLHSDGSRYFTVAGDVYPDLPNRVCNLGTSDKKWKTLNGINPGALSLPNLNYSDSNQWIDLSGNITDETGGSNEYDPTVDGWVVIRADNNPTSLRVNVHAPRPSARKYLASRTGVATPDGIMIVSVPAPAGSRVYIYFNKGSGSLDSATFITCQGNV